MIFEYLQITFSMPVLIAIVLGPIAENGFTQSLAISGGNYGIFFGSPITWILWVITFALIIPPLLTKQKDMDHSAS